MIDLKLLITGGCKNGKSFYAQNLVKELAQGGPLYYIATMVPTDSEDRERIVRHQQERAGWGFETLEQPQDIHHCLKVCGPEASVLLDSSTALLANEMFLPTGEINEKAGDKVGRELLALCRGVKNIAVVSDWIYSDAQRFDPLTEGYRKALASLDRRLASQLGFVYEVSFGRVIKHKESGV